MDGRAGRAGPGLLPPDTGQEPEGVVSERGTQSLPAALIGQSEPTVGPLVVSMTHVNFKKCHCRMSL